MIAIRKHSLYAGLLVALFAVGCANQKEPATKAVNDAETTLASLREEAGQYAASELAAADSALASMKSRPPLVPGESEASRPERSKRDSRPSSIGTHSASALLA